MKRVLHVIDHLGLGGAQAVLLDLVTLADRTEWQCEVAAMHGQGLFADLLRREGIRVHSLSPRLWPPCYVSSFIKLQQQFDILHFHLTGSNWVAKPLAALVGNQPRIVHDHASADLQFRGMTSMFVDAVMHRFSSHTIAVAPEVKKFLLRYEGLSEDEVTVIVNGVNTEIFRPCSLEEKKEARQFFGLEENIFVIGTVGRLASEKNQAMFLKAAAMALQQGLQAVFLIAGTGPEEESLKQLARQLGVSAQVRFLGRVENRVALYRSLDFFALTSLYEGLPIVLLEAMASGVPVVSTDLEGIVRVLIQDSMSHALLPERQCGFVVPSDDSRSLAAIFLNADSHHRELLAQNARCKVEAEFSAQQAVEKLGMLYRSCLI